MRVCACVRVAGIDSRASYVGDLSQLPDTLLVGSLMENRRGGARLKQRLPRTADVEEKLSNELKQLTDNKLKIVKWEVLRPTRQFCEHRKVSRIYMRLRIKEQVTLSRVQ